MLNAELKGVFVQHLLIFIINLVNQLEGKESIRTAPVDIYP